MGTRHPVCNDENRRIRQGIRHQRACRCHADTSLPADDKAAKGNILNVTTTMTTNPIATMANYAASKAAVYTMTRAWAKELAKDGVRVNSLGVGPIETPIYGKTELSDEARKPTRIW